MMAGKWIVEKVGQYEHITSIIVFLLDEFSRIFGKDIMYNENCIVYNDPHSTCPMLITNMEPIHIRLAQENLSAISQMIYQLSHEMCHYAIRQKKTNKSFTLSWFEEIICEATSLYALEYASKEWAKCSLSQNQPFWKIHHASYLTNLLSKPVSNGFEMCDTIEKLIAYEKEEKPENQRETHRAERNFIYKTISTVPLELKYVLDYTQYIESNGVTINFDKWIKDAPCTFLRNFQQIYPIKSNIPIRNI